MPFVEDDLSGHPIWVQVDQFSTTLDAFDSAGDAQVLLRVGALRGLIADAHGLRSIPARRFPGVPGGPSDGLVPLGSAFDEATSVLTAFASSDSADTSTLCASLDAVLDRAATSLNALPSIMQQEPDAERERIRDFEADVQRAIEHLQSVIAERTSELDALRVQIAEDKTGLEASVQALQSTIDVANNDVTAQKTRLDTAITEQVTRFGTQMAEWQAAHSELLATEQKASEDAIEAANTEARLGRTAIMTQAEAFLESLAKKEGEAKNLVHGTSRWAVSTQYAGYARSETVKATAWSIASTLLAIVALSAMILTLSNIQGVTTSEAIFKSTLSLAILAVAGFMAKEASGHHKEARDAKRVQLDLNALEPFVANLDDETQDQLRVATALRVFNRPLANPRHGTPDPFGFQVEGALQSIMKGFGIGGQGAPPPGP